MNGDINVNNINEINVDSLESKIRTNGDQSIKISSTATHVIEMECVGEPLEEVVTNPFEVCSNIVKTLYNLENEDDEYPSGDVKSNIKPTNIHASDIRDTNTQEAVIMDENVTNIADNSPKKRSIEDATSIQCNERTPTSNVNTFSYKKPKNQNNNKNNSSNNNVMKRQQLTLKDEIPIKFIHGIQKGALLNMWSTKYQKDMTPLVCFNNFIMNTLLNY